MEAASSKIILERLKEEWMEVADASVYRELELEKQRWMLFALRDLKTTRLSGCEDSRTIQVSTSGATKVLSLYENHASFLSALSDPITEVHHLHPNPLSTKSYPNTKPFTIQEPTIQLPYPDNSLTSIHAFSLPTQFPASSIPTILKECHRLLSPNTPSSQSTLHLTLIDPLPISSTLGPLLRTWLEDHLIYNLERQFLCITPSRLFPMWLQDVGLRAEGSMILTVPFLASINTMEAEAILRDTNQGTGIDKTGIVKQELKSVVGRMLWKERWGGFVQAKRWWWEDEEIVGECERLRTCWEYSVIDAVKEG
ncbi:hypothetical protein M7I_7279 [Glarea lozoyensis 74030]|uniref:Uncharacterized protein n=1 Tax=Glarea lozoyensis (strain ATCC 74030 / MF5533) TaxID=1104152 RepID=H0EWV5_GLAL7|nr:hypothetical protein M7I_7279 [Glarea lozoyensis 74030]